jgi:HK97 gp10 family phage protein
VQLERVGAERFRQNKGPNSGPFSFLEYEKLTTTVTLTGIEEMKRQLQALPAEIRKTVLAGALFAGAKTLRDEVKSRAPVRTGNLRNNIIAYRDRHPEQFGAAVHYSVMVKRLKVARKVKRLLRRAKNAGASIRIVDDAYYWRFLEYGTSKMSARPFFRPAIDVVQPQLVKIVGDQLQVGIDRAAKKLGAK